MEKNHSPKDDCGWSLCALSYPRPGKTKIEGDETDVILTFEQPERLVPPAFQPQLPRTACTADDQARSKTWFSNQNVARKYRSRVLSLPVLFTRTPPPKPRPIIGLPTNFRKVGGASPMPLLEAMSERILAPIPENMRDSMSERIPWSTLDRTRDSAPEPIWESSPVSRRESFRRLELSIYSAPTDRLSPLPDFSSGDWEAKLPQLARPNAALLRRGTLDNSELPSEHSIPRKPLSTHTVFNGRRNIMSESFLAEVKSTQRVSREQSISSRHGSTHEPNAASETRRPSSQTDTVWPTARPSSQGSMGSVLSRRSSLSESRRRLAKGSGRRAKTDEVDEAIRELNTIVEDKRKQARKGSMSPEALSSTHVSAIAPNMKMQARSQTLQDIGSAFHTHLAVQTVQSGPWDQAGTPESEIRRPFTARSRYSQTHLSLDIYSSGRVANSATSSVTVLPHFPLPDGFISDAPDLPSITRTERLSAWLKRSRPMSANSKASSQVMPSHSCPPSDAAQTEDVSTQAVSDRASFSTVSSCISPNTPSSGSFHVYESSTTATRSSTTMGTVTTSVPIVSKSPRHARRASQRGSSVDTTWSFGLALDSVPPAYHEFDTHAKSLSNSYPVPKLADEVSP